MNFSCKLLLGLIVLLGMSAFNKLGAKKITVQYNCVGVPSTHKGSTKTATINQPWPPTMKNMCIEVSSGQGPSNPLCNRPGQMCGPTYYNIVDAKGTPGPWVNCCPTPRYMK